MSSAAAAKKETKLGIDAKKSEDMASWYTQVRNYDIRLSYTLNFIFLGLVEGGNDGLS